MPAACTEHPEDAVANECELPRPRQNCSKIFIWNLHTHCVQATKIDVAMAIIGFGASSPSGETRVLLLVSGAPEDGETQAAIALLREQHVRFAVVDARRERAQRDELLAAARLDADGAARAPHCFLARDGTAPRHIGDLATVRRLLDVDELPSAYLEAHPTLPTFARTFAPALLLGADLRFADRRGELSVG